MDLATLWHVDAAGNVRPRRPGTSMQPAALPLPSPSAPLSLRPSVSAHRRPLLARSLALPAASGADHSRYPEPIDVSASLAFASPAGASYNCYSFDTSYAAACAAFAPEISPSSAAATPSPSALAAVRTGRKTHHASHASLKKQTKKKGASPHGTIAANSSSASSSAAASSTERGRRFRKRLQEREVQARADIELLRQQIVCIQSLKRSVQHQALFSHHRALCQSIAATNASAFATAAPQIRAEMQLGGVADGGLALRFVREYFALFRYGVLSADANPDGTTAGVALDTSRHEAFLGRWAAPDIKFDGFVGVTPMIDQWRRYSSVHSFIKLDPVNMEVQVVGGRATVVAKGVLHIRYSRRTLESVFPRLLSEQPALAERLVGRLVHMHYTSHYFFDEAGKLVSQQIVPDFVSAFKDVLGSLDDVAKVLECALLKEHVLGEIDYDRYVEKPAVGSEGDQQQGSGASGDARPEREARRSPTSGGGMDIEFLLS